MSLVEELNKIMKKINEAIDVYDRISLLVSMDDLLNGYYLKLNPLDYEVHCYGYRGGKYFIRILDGSGEEIYDFSVENLDELIQVLREEFGREVKSIEVGG